MVVSILQDQQNKSNLSILENIVTHICWPVLFSITSILISLAKRLKKLKIWSCLNSSLQPCQHAPTVSGLLYSMLYYSNPCSIFSGFFYTADVLWCRQLLSTEPSILLSKNWLWWIASRCICHSLTAFMLKHLEWNWLHLHIVQILMEYT